MKALDNWWRQELAPESWERFRELLDAQRYDRDDADRCEALLDAFLGTLTETQLQVFARLLREMTQQVH